MINRTVRLAAFALGALACAACAADPAPRQKPPRQAQTQGPTLRAFGSDAELSRYVGALAAEYRRSNDFAGVGKAGGVAQPAAESEVPAPAVVPAEMAPADRAGESITNVQHAGVDEGGIVKVHGDYLVILRRGRLFTVRIGGDELRPVSASDAFGPGIDPSGTWIDEMLVSGDRVVVIGYSYQRGGTEVGVFRLDGGGGLTWQSTYQVRSGDYYSSRNFASRLVDGKLVLYSPVPLYMGDGDGLAGFPAVRRWGAGDTTFHRTAPATRVYRPASDISAREGVMLHTVTVCSFVGDGMDCQATALIGPEGRVFYVSRTAVYVWASRERTNERGNTRPPASMLYRMPLDGSAPVALGVSGGPIDQLSFLESGDGALNVLVEDDGNGETMWRQEYGGGVLSLLRVPLSSFGDGSRAAAADAYRRLPTPGDGALQNRFVGDWLLYGRGAGWDAAVGSSRVFAVRWAGGGAVDSLALPHGVDRLEAMGSGAVVVGGDGRDLHFSGVRLDRAHATLAGRYTRPNAAQGETRTHGFFYRPDEADAGLLGLPIAEAGRPGYAQLDRGSASVLFLRNRAFDLTEAGALASRDANAPDDACRVSCVDWYGNARPIFLRGRIFALMGYELVEGRDAAGRIRELRRVSFAPGRALATRTAQ